MVLHTAVRCKILTGMYTILLHAPQHAMPVYIIGSGSKIECREVHYEVPNDCRTDITGYVTIYVTNVVMHILCHVTDICM